MSFIRSKKIDYSQLEQAPACFPNMPKAILCIFVSLIFGCFLCIYGCSVFQKSHTPPLTKQTDSISQIVSSIIELSEDSSVLILGEHHGNPESQKLTVALVKGLIHQEKKVFLGMEIPSSSQDDLERVLVGEEPVCQEFISSIVDHLAYQEMLIELGMLKAKGVPLYIRAIDAPPSVKGILFKSPGRKICPKNNMLILR